MQKKKEYSVSINILAAMLMLAGVAAVAAETKGKEDNVVEKITVTEKTTHIQLELQGNSSIVLVETDNVFGLRNLKYSGVKASPITVKQSGDTIKVTQKSGHKSWFRPDPLTVSYELLLPKNREVSISADHAEFTGSVNAADLHINGGNLVVDGLTVRSADKVSVTGGVAHINMTITECKALKLSLGTVSGRIMVPDGVPVSNTTGASTISIDRASAVDGKKAKKTSWGYEINPGTFLASGHPGKFYGCSGH